MKISWKSLLALLKKRGYDGDGSIKSVKSFVAEEGIDLVDTSGDPIDLDKLHKNKTVTISADAGEEVVILDPEPSAAMEDEEDPEAKAEGEDDDEDMQKSIRRLTTEVRRLKSATIRGGGVDSRISRASAGGGGGSFSAQAKRYDARVREKHLMSPDRRPVFGNGDTALAAGAFFRQKFREQAPAFAHMLGKADNDLAIIGEYFGTKASSTMDLTGGAGFVPEDFANDIIENLEDYGVAAANAQVVTMSRDVQHFPVHTADSSWSVVGEGSTVTQSDPTNSQVSLTAAKWGKMSLVSSELVHDGVIPWADYIGRESSRSLASAEDTSLFIGNGLSAHRFIRGATTRLQDVDLAGTDSAGLVSASGNLFSEFVLGDFDSTCGTLPDYADGGAKWYCSRAFYFKVMLPLESSNALQGEIEGKPARMFRGYPVEFVQVMPTTQADTTVFAIFGDLSRGAMLGRVGGSMQIDFSDQRYFDSDQLAFRCLQRTAINVHDVGDASRVGPIVGLQSVT